MKQFPNSTISDVTLCVRRFLVTCSRSQPRSSALADLCVLGAREPRRDTRTVSKENARAEDFAAWPHSLPGICVRCLARRRGAREPRRDTRTVSKENARALDFAAWPHSLPRICVRCLARGRGKFATVSKKNTVNRPGGRRFGASRAATENMRQLYTKQLKPPRGLRRAGDHPKKKKGGDVTL